MKLEIREGMDELKSGDDILILTPNGSISIIADKEGRELLQKAIDEIKDALESGECVSHQVCLQQSLINDMKPIYEKIGEINTF